MSVGTYLLNEWVNEQINECMSEWIWLEDLPNSIHPNINKLWVLSWKQRADWWLPGAGGKGEVGEVSEDGQRVQTSSYKMTGDVMYIMVTIVNNAFLYIWKLLRE